MNRHGAAPCSGVHSVVCWLLPCELQKVPAQWRAGTRIGGRNAQALRLVRQTRSRSRSGAAFLVGKVPWQANPSRAGTVALRRLSGSQTIVTVSSGQVAKATVVKAAVLSEMKPWPVADSRSQ